MKFNIESIGLAFIAAWNQVSNTVHDMAVEKGWWEKGERNFGEVVALMHSELSEALEGARHGNPSSDKIPDFTSVEEELADVVIRIMDYAAAEDLHLADAILAKIRYNASRPHKHGGKAF